MDRDQVAAAVREVLRELLQQEPPRQAGGPMPTAPDGMLVRARHKPQQSPFDPTELQRIKDATPARLAKGRTGTRFLTEVSIHLRAEHAIALDAVHSAVPEDFAAQHGCIPLQTRCTTHDEYLLYPDHGRRLDDASRTRLEKEGTRGADVQVILGDGLSAWAALEQGPELVPALQRGLEAAGYKTGMPLFVRYARIGVADEIGVLLGCKATAILVGERPGLGTGDSLSIYTAHGPKLGQDNAEKDCISNVRPLGFPPEEAARECVLLLKRTFAAGGGGIHLTQSGT
ncbi:MAG: ethanolamine ammonia-lyase subunit EutC [Deltaproteobacteria bacterium]|nr:ethanolamine ammonia-lyase subunit EutC [Deltaproteobacteria bacterium]